MVGKQQLGRYRLGEAIGRGGMGLVYRAEDSDTGEVVALKVLPADSIGPLTGYRRDLLRLWSEVQHPHIAKVRDIGVEGDTAYIATDFIEGVDSSRLILNEPLPPHRAFKYAADIADALSALHRIGLVHRDIKPSNIIITDRDEAVLTDLGLATEISNSRLDEERFAIVGTPRYMAPELFSDEDRASPSSDVYSLACVLFEYLTGRPAFSGNSIAEILGQKFYREPPHLPSTLTREFPDADLVLSRSLSPVVAARAASAGEFERQIQAAYDGSRLSFLRDISSAAISTSLSAGPVPMRPASGLALPDVDIAGAMTTLRYPIWIRAAAAKGVIASSAFPVGLASVLCFIAVSINGQVIAAAVSALVPVAAYLIYGSFIFGKRKLDAQLVPEELSFLVTRNRADFRRMKVSLAGNFTDGQSHRTIRPDSTNWL